MYCEQFEEVLAQQPGGPLPLDATSHLAACGRCRLVREDLLAIELAAQEWGSQELAPPSRVWASIQAQLQAEGLFAPPVPVAEAGWLAHLWNWAPRLELAGAYVLLMLVAAGLAGYQFAPSASSSLDNPATAVEVSKPTLDRLDATLDGNMQRVVASFTPDEDSVALSIQQNMRIVDNLIAVCEKTVREHPGDPLAREYLYGAYQQKADLLAVAMDRSTMEIK
jgi:hypothetical protein